MLKWSSTDGRIEAQFQSPLTDDPASTPINLKARLLRPYDSTTQDAIFLSGGPGISATELVDHPTLRPRFEPFAERFNFCVLDQRGTGGSGLSWPLDPQHFKSDISNAGVRESIRSQISQWQLDHPGVAEYVNPWNSARDVVFLAQSLRQPTLIAVSYGTHLAMAALKLNSASFGPAILLGFEGPDQTFKYPQTTEEYLEKIDPELPELIRRATGAVDPEEQFLFQWMLSTWYGLSTLAARMKPLCIAVLDGEFEPWTKAKAAFLRRTATKPAAFYLCDAGSHASPARAEAIHRQESVCCLGGTANFPFFDIELPRLPDWYREPLKSEHEMLVVTGAMDGFTPTSNYLESREWLPNSTHVEVDGAFHDDLLLSPKTSQVVQEYLG
ncbi:MAG: hypothetical protein JST40_00825 [Armatimonadetes bacterium]|nr:hypothetical protein [Armatimonadota bacterium]